MTHRSASEGELLEGCRRADPPCVAELIRRHQPALARTLLRLVRDVAVAEEIVQETFLRICREATSIDRGARPWLFRVALNLGRDHLKHRGASPVPSLSDDAMPLFVAPADDPERRLLSAERSRALDRAIQKLPSEARELLLLRYVEELGYSEIARIMGVPGPVLRMRAVRARARLLELLREEAS